MVRTELTGAIANVGRRPHIFTTARPVIARLPAGIGGRSADIPRIDLVRSAQLFVGLALGIVSLLGRTAGPNLLLLGVHARLLGASLSHLRFRLLAVRFHGPFTPLVAQFLRLDNLSLTTAGRTTAYCHDDDGHDDQRHYYNGHPDPRTHDETSRTRYCMHSSTNVQRTAAAPHLRGRNPSAFAGCRDASARSSTLAHVFRIATFNVNGIRAAERRGFPAWLAARTPDVLAVQEMRCPEADVPDVFGDYHLIYHPGTLAGRNGVALATRAEPNRVRVGFGSREFDTEGRYVEADLDLAGGRRIRVASVYVPKGGTPYEDEASLAKMQRKFRFLRSFARHLTASRREALKEGREFVVMGDWNIAPSALDLKNWRTNQKSEGFLPEERAWIAAVQSPRTLVDVVRGHLGDEAGPYSWWSWRGKAFDKDAGWRIDYQLATPTLARAAAAAGTDRDASYDTRISDHAPVVVDYHV